MIKREKRPKRKETKNKRSQKYVPTVRLKKRSARGIKRERKRVNQKK